MHPSDSSLIIRSKAEQSIGQEQIKALSHFKLNKEAPLSSTILQNIPSQEAFIVSLGLEGNQCRQRLKCKISETTLQGGDDTEMDVC
jgi:hypothetical protein